MPLLQRRSPTESNAEAVNLAGKLIKMKFMRLLHAVADRIRDVWSSECWCLDSRRLPTYQVNNPCAPPRNSWLSSCDNFAVSPYFGHSGPLLKKVACVLQKYLQAI